MAEKTSSQIVLRLNDGYQRSFFKPEDAVGFLESEQKYWEFVRESNANPDARLRGAFDKVSQLINRARKLSASSEEPQVIALREALEKQTQEAYSAPTQRLIASDSPQADYAMKLESERNAMARNGALLWFTRTISPQDELNSEHRIGSHLAMEFELGRLGERNVDTSRVASILTNLEEVLRESEKNRTDSKSDSEQLLNSWKTAFEDKDSKIDSKFTSIFDSAEKKLKSIEDTYDQKLALQSSVSYWKAKQNSHTKSAIVWGIVSSIGIASAAAIFSYVVHEILGDTNISDVQAWQVTTSLVLLTFLIWIVRTMMRIFLSHTHSREDAVERVTMIQTYLAMLRDPESGMTSDDRKVIYDSLFRPGQFGLIREDGPGIFEWLNRDK